MQIGKNSNLNQNGEEVENDQIVPFLGLAVFDNLFLQALILLDECVQTNIKLPTDSDEIANIRDTFLAFPAGNGRAGNLESFSQGFLSELMLLTNIFENLRDFHDDSLSNNINNFSFHPFHFYYKKKILLCQ